MNPKTPIPETPPPDPGRDLYIRRPEAPSDDPGWSGHVPKPKPDTSWGTRADEAPPYVFYTLMFIVAGLLCVAGIVLYDWMLRDYSTMRLLATVGISAFVLIPCALLWYWIFGRGLDK